MDNKLLDKKIWYEKVETPSIKFVDLRTSNGSFSEVKVIPSNNSIPKNKINGNEANTKIPEEPSSNEFSIYYYLEKVLNNYNENKYISTFCKYGNDCYAIGGRYLISNKGFVDLWDKDKKIGEINNKYIKNGVRTLVNIQEDKLFIGTDDTIQIVDSSGNLILHKYVKHPADSVFFSEYGFVTLTNSIGLIIFYDNEMNVRDMVYTKCIDFHFIVNSSNCNNYVYVVCKSVIKIFDLRTLEQTEIKRYTNTDIKSVTGIKNKRIFLETENFIEIYDLESTSYAVIERRSQGDGICNVGTRLIKLSDDELEIDECLKNRIYGEEESINIENLFEEISDKIENLGMKRENLFGIVEKNEDIEDLENTIGIKLPYEYKYYLLNYQFILSKCYLEGNWFMLNVKSVIKKYKFMNVINTSRLNKEYSEFVLEDSIKKNMWNEKWIPIATNINGDFILIDMDPNISSHVGQILLYRKGVGPVRVEDNNFLSWIKKFRDDLNSDMYEFNEKKRQLIYKF